MTTRIDSIYAFVTVDPLDNTEGVMAFQSRDGMWMPMVCADAARVDSLRPIALTMAKQLKVTVTLVHFTTRTVLEVLP